MRAKALTDSTLRLAVELINKASVTPLDEGCQDMIEKRLIPLGFRCESLPFEDVSNLWARKGSASPVLCFAGHTDVVPPGDLDAWQSDPFTPDIRDGFLYGRGAADMKGGLAAMITAAERFVKEHPDFDGSLAFLITSDEEGVARHGTRMVVDTLKARGEQIDFCVVGEPSSDSRPGDTIRNGRRGSLTGSIHVRGVQGHVAYGHLATNPIRQFAPALAELNETVWDHGDEHFPPTTFEVVHLLSSSGATNVIPGSLDAKFNLRYGTTWRYQDLQEKVEATLATYGMDCEIQWHLSGEPFLTRPGKLTEAASQAVRDIQNIEATFSTGGGTSDGRFISPMGADVIELGPVNASIHKVNEHVEVTHLTEVSKLYQRMMELMLLQ